MNNMMIINLFENKSGLLHFICSFHITHYKHAFLYMYKPLSLNEPVPWACLLSMKSACDSVHLTHHSFIYLFPVTALS